MKKLHFLLLKFQILAKHARFWVIMFNQRGLLLLNGILYQARKLSPHNKPLSQ